MWKEEHRGSEAASVNASAEAFEKAPYLRNPPLRRAKQSHLYLVSNVIDYGSTVIDADMGCGRWVPPPILKGDEIEI